MAPSTTPTSPIEAFVDMHFAVRHHGSEEWDVLCPSHGDRNASMRINVVKGKFMCHGCGVRGGMTKLARLVGQTWRPSNEQEMRLAMLQAKLASLKQGTGVHTVRTLPESALLRYQLETPYWTDRGLTAETVRAFDLGYDPINDCVTIPVRNVHGELLGFTRRFLDFDPTAEEDDEGAKYKDPKGFRKADNLFASWMAALDESPVVVLCEGPLDAVKVWQAGHPAVAQYGSYITPRQIRLLRQLGTIEVILFYDNDNGGRKATDYAKGFEATDAGRIYDPSHDLRKFFIVKRVVYRGSSKDPGEMPDPQIDRAIREARPIR